MIPIYRAKKIDSDEWVIGFLIHETIKVSNDGEKDSYLDIDDYAITSKSGYNYDVIDPTTLSIHFNDMLDSEGAKIFASLQEDGKGGDIYKYDLVGFGKFKETTLIFKDCELLRDKISIKGKYLRGDDSEVIGIQK